MMEEQYILILGATSDIGRATARKYASQGYNLILAARNHLRLENEMNDLSLRYEVRVKSVEFDALDFNSHFNFYLNLDPKPYGVICMVGYLGSQEVAEKNPEEAKRIIDTNFNGCVSVLNFAALDLERHEKGFIVGVSSVAGERGRGGNYYYGSAKAGFTAYLSGLRNRLFKKNVHVLTVIPGFVKTKMTEGMDLPPVITASPEKVASDIFRAQQKKKNVLYTTWHWRFIMAIIKFIPEGIFKKMKL